MPGELVEAVRNLLESQRLAVLATQGDRQPHLSLMAFAVTGDLSKLILVTDRDTRKFANLLACPRAAILVDNRSDEMADAEEAMAVTAVGRVEEVAASEREATLRLFLTRHPHLEGFARSGTSALMRMRVESYRAVRRFQLVEELRLPVD